MKRVWAVILCLALMIPTIGITATTGVSALEDYGGYVLADIGLRASISTTHAGGQVLQSAQSFDAIDLTKLGCHAPDGSGRIIEAGKLALQFDTYVDGDAAFQGALSGLDGQAEMTSSGTCDKNELMVWANQVMQFNFGNWKRYTVDLNKFYIPTAGVIDVTKWNYFRIYFSCKGGTGCKYTMKICNVRLVDLTKQAPTVEEDPIGDGTFVPDAPVWRLITPPAGYDVDETIVAGYDLKEYVEAHKEESKIKQCLQKDDYAPIIQSLIDGLSEAGGGALYIPSGHWSCRTEFEVKSGTSIYGDWKKPDGKSKAEGTIIDVYAGKGSVSGSPCVKLANTSTVQDLTFWYPEQSFTEPTPYTATVGLGGFTIARNLTFINSYTAIKHGPEFSNCPDITNVYGTPVSAGVDVDMIIDIARFENMNFAADYWINSGLPGSPASPDDQETLRTYLYYNAIGATMGRIDWSYMTYLNVDGYQSGLVFNRTDAGNVPNGQCLNLHFKNCQTGLYVVDVQTTGEMVANSTFENCANGVWLGQMADNVAGNGYLALINCDIDATDYAIRNQQGNMVQVLSSTIRQGLVAADYGWYNLINTKFETEAPQVYLETGTLSANILGCTNKKGGAISVENEALCPVTNKSQKIDAPAVPTYTDAEVLERNLHVANRKVYLITDLDRTGKTDVTSALQAKLDAAATDGGIVYLICGNYRLDGSITVPTGVELRGINDINHYYNKKSTSFDVYSTKTTDPAIIMEEGSGLRALDIWYPEQGRNNDYLWYEKYTEYPYTIQGRGKDIYIINVGLCNSWDGLDLMTYRCDNHYVDYLAGYPYHNFIAVGGGSKNGTLRHFQVNPNSLTWTALDDPANFESNMYKQTLNDSPVCIVGDAENEMIYQCFNYGSYAGIQFVAEDSGAATARVIGCAMDCTTVCVDVQAAEKVDILNLQMVSFYFRKELEKEPFHIQLGADNKGTVNVTGCLFWNNPSRCVNVQGGTLNIYGLNYFTDDSHLSNISANASLNIYGGYFKRTNSSVGLASSNTDRVHLIGGYYNKLPGGAAKAGEFTDMMFRPLRWDVPQSKADVSDTILFTESFTASTDNITFTKGVSGDASINYQSGNAILNPGTTNSVVLTGNADLSGIAATPNVMKDNKYHVAFRTKIDKLPENNQFMFIMSASNGDTITPIVFTNGKINDGENDLTSFKTDTWYRVAIDVDMVAMTYTLTVKDDSGKLVALGDTKALPETIKEENAGINNVSFMCSAFPAAATVADAAQVELDYVYASYQDGLLGDVDGDGDITSTDARLVLQCYAKKIDESALNTAVADVDGDGDITSTDARLILQYYAKKIDHFPAQG